MRKRGTGCGRQSRLTGRSGHRRRSGQGPGGHPCSPSPAIVSLSGRPWVCPQGGPAMLSVPSPHASGNWQALASGPRFLGKRVRSHRLLGAAGPRVWSAGHPASPPAVTRSGLAARGRVIASPVSASRRPCRGPYVQRWLTCAILPGSRWVTVRTQTCRPQAQELWARGAAWPGPAAATAPAAHGETPGVPDARCDTGRSRASSFRWAPPPPRSRIWFCDRPCAAISE